MFKLKLYLCHAQDRKAYIIAPDFNQAGVMTLEVMRERYKNLVSYVDRIEVIAAEDDSAELPLRIAKKDDA